MAIIDRKMEIFSVAAQLKNFSEAAATLGMTQPNITQQIARLEADLGLKLFKRNGRKLDLTDAGQALLKECTKLFAEAGEIRRRVGNASKSRKFYRIGGTMTAGGYILPELVAHYMQRHSLHNIEICVANTIEIASRLKMHALDLGLVEGPFDRELFSATPLLKDRLILVSAPGLIAPQLELGAYIASGKRLILREVGSGTRYYFDCFIARHHLPTPKPENVVVANSFDAIKHLVGNGFGVSVISELAVRDELRSGQLVAATMKEGEIMRDINFICMPQDNLRFAEDFIAFCRAEQRNIASPTN